MILVTGGTGIVGSAIVAELQKQGQSVAVLGRDAAKIRRVFGDGRGTRRQTSRDRLTGRP